MVFLMTTTTTTEATEALITSLRRVTVKPFNRSVWNAIGILIKSQDDFTSDDIWITLEKMGVKVPSDPRAMGAALAALSLHGAIAKTGEYRKATGERAVRNHNREQAVWKFA